MRIISSQDLFESYSNELLDEGIRSTIGRFFGRKPAPQPKPESRGEFLRRKYNIGSGSTSPRGKLLQKTGVDNNNPYYKGGLNLHHVGTTSGSGGNKWRRRLVTNLGIYNKQANPRLKYDVYAPDNRRPKNEEFELWVNSLINEGYDLSDYTWEEAFELYESYSTYLDLTSFLINEGYADSLYEADEIIENLDEETLDYLLS